MATPFSALSHPLSRAGTSRPDRRLLALDPAFAPVEAHSEADFLAYVFELARTAVYHSYEDGVLRKSDWQDFFRLALPFQTTQISRFDLDALQSDFAAALEQFESGLDQGNLYPVYSRIFNLALLLNQWHQQLPESAQLRSDLQNLLENDLSYALQNLIGTANDAQKALGELGDTFHRPDYLTPLLANPAWQVSLADLLTGGVPILNALPKAKGTLADKKRYYRDRAIAFFQIFFQGVARIVERAQQLAHVEASGTHPAHLGLLYAFLRLYGLVQTDLNRLTERHLDFYYRQVLGLHAKPAVPDLLHLVLELDKGRPKHLVDTGTAYKASTKDAKGAEIHFTLPEEALLNQAQVLSLRTLYRQTDQIGQLTGLFAAAANSFDGKGAPFQDPAKANWNTLGAALAPDGVTPHDPARVGFLIASPVLLLREGNPTVTISFTHSGTPAPTAAEITAALRARYSSEKNWSDETAVTCTAISPLTLTFQVQAGKPLVFASPKALGVDLGTTLPLVKFELPAQPTAAHWKTYAALAALTITDVTVSVSNVQVRNLLMQNDEGPVDPNKPFLPFGAQPSIGASLYVGSEEAFRKKITALSLHCTWDKLDFGATSPDDNFTTWYKNYTSPPSNTTFQAKIYALNKGTWTANPNANQQLFPTAPWVAGAVVSQQFNGPVFPGAPMINDEIQPYQVGTADGFLRMDLVAGDFYHAEYPKILTEKMVGTLTYDSGISGYKTTFSNVPNPPYTPTIRDFYLQYSAADQQSAGTLLFAHLHPFEAQNLEYAGPAAALNMPLFPAFTDEGTLLIGLQNLSPGSNLQLLFQLAEATADPDVEPQPQKPVWEYLSGNTWKPLLPDQQVLDDASHGLIASGIVKLALPFDLSSEKTTILPNQYHWLRVSLLSGTAGLSDTIGVHAQAIKTTALLAAENDTDRLSQPLAAGSVTKPVVADAGVKKIKQPYESFSGQPAESAPVFRQRVSERLRHKGRAVALYDYERMVLEQFPQVYQVKCLTHTQARVLPLEDLYLAPGYVVLAVIPEISRLQFAEKLEPKASRALLYEIDMFLKKKTSTFVTVKAVNPQFQKVDVAANVAFFPGKDIAYYEIKLREDVLRFLTPWAFNDQGGPSFGGKVYQSAILHFVEKLPYVDYVTDFKLTEHGSTNQQGVAVVEARTERSIIAAGNINFSGTGAVCPPNPQSGQAAGLGQQFLGTSGGLKIGS